MSLFDLFAGQSKDNMEDQEDTNADEEAEDESDSKKDSHNNNSVKKTDRDDNAIPNEDQTTEPRKKRSRHWLVCRRIMFLRHWTTHTRRMTTHRR
jgi:hypothetical protein